MTKIDGLKSELFPLLTDFLQSNNSKGLKDFLCKNSNLPGPRGNLELAYSLSGLMDDYSERELQQLFNHFEEWIKIDTKVAPVNSPEEFVVFCAVHSLGRIGSISEKFRINALTHLRKMANDTRWRTREAVCMGLQFLLSSYPEFVIENFYNWIKDKNYLELRAIVTAFADPPLLKEKIISQNGLKIHRKVFDIIIETKDRKSEEFRVLKKAMGFSFSLIALIYPPNSFGVMKKLLELNDKDITWIVKENITKNRLIKNFPDRVEEIKNILNNK